MTKKIDIINKKFGRLTVIEECGYHIKKNGAKLLQYKCQCDCGNSVIVTGENLRSGNSKSCGCYNHDKIMERSIKHNGCRDKLYGTYHGIIQRCNCKTHKFYKDYGGRGIKVCDEWSDYNIFKKWAIQNGYKPDLTIDRINNDGNYEPSNCRWVSQKIQSRNRRNNKKLTFNGETHCISEWAEIIGIKSPTLWARLNIYNMGIEKALTMPLKTYT